MTGRYQSKVFNLLSRYSMKLRDQSAQTWRQAKVAAIWSLQIVLYPIYVGFQSSRLVGKQLRQATRQTLPRLRAATQRLISAEPHLLAEPDEPIQQTLDTVRSLGVQLANHQPVVLLSESNAPLAERELAYFMQQRLESDPEALSMLSSDEPLDLAAVRIRGIASDRTTRKLVLVTTRNQSLDLLTPEQADHLARRIVAETALYWRQQRLLRPPEVDRFLVSTYLSPAPVQQNALPPIRLFQKLMAWMQRSSVAQSANLFQESRLPALPPLLNPSDGLDESLQPILRSAQSGWLAAEAQFSDWFKQSQRQVSNQLGSLLGYGTFWSVSEPPPIDTSAVPVPSSDSVSWLEQVDSWLSKIPGLRAQPLLPTQDQVYPDLALSQFNRSVPFERLPRPVQQWPPPQSATPADSTGQLAANPSWEVVDTAALEQQIKPAIVQRSPSQSVGMQRDTLTPKTRRSTAIHAAIHTVDPLDIEHLEAPLSSLDTANLEEAAMMPQSWIETEAQLVRYEKHPLTQLLEWLDQGMLWVEDRVTQLWNWMTRLLK